tara:strand:+ start:1049 stop:1249 length:201 start_codon:yes stop_codon:yes gene_type:complete
MFKSKLVDLASVYSIATTADEFTLFKGQDGVTLSWRNNLGEFEVHAETLVMLEDKLKRNDFKGIYY